MGRPLFKTERTIIAALLDALADQAPTPSARGPLTCDRLQGGGDRDCDDEETAIDKQCYACRVFSGLRIADDALNAIAEREATPRDAVPSSYVVQFLQQRNLHSVATCSLNPDSNATARRSGFVCDLCKMLGRVS